MKTWSWKRWIWSVGLLLAATMWFVDRDDGTIKWSQFYNLNVELEHLGKPLNLHVVISCGSVGRQILGEGRSARSYWAPYIYGIEDQGHGVLVQTPGICGRDFAKHPIPEDYMPVLFWAPEAKNLEFMIAYLHEDAYAQPVSKLKFIKATMTNATRDEYEVWRRTEWKRNIVPLASRYQDHVRGLDFFREVPGTGKPYFHPDGDVRNKAYRFACHSMMPMRLPNDLREYARQFWPSDKPKYWLLRRDKLKERITSIEGNEAIRKLSLRTGGEFRSFGGTALDSFSISAGVTRTAAAAKLPDPYGPTYYPRYDAGLSHRIPYRSDTGYPWATSELAKTKANTLTFDTANGAGKGFGYCFREVVKAFLGTPKLAQPGLVEIVPHTQRIVIDGQLIGETPNTISSSVPHDAIMERDEFIWAPSSFSLATETARVNQ